MVSDKHGAADAAAVMVLEGGSSWRQATAATDVSMGSLATAIERVSKDPERLKEASQNLAASHLVVAQKAVERIHGKIDQLPDDLLIRAYGVASDKAALYLGIGKDGTGASGGDGLSGARSLSLLVQALEGREVTVSVRDLSQDDASGQPKDVK